MHTMGDDKFLIVIFLDSLNFFRCLFDVAFGAVKCLFIF